MWRCSKMNLVPNDKKAALVLFATVLAGCAIDSKKTEPDQVVEERAQARWELVVERDFVSAYEFRTPGYRERTRASDYAVDMSVRPVHWTAAKVQEVQCESPEKCIVTITVSYKVPSAPRGINQMVMSRNIEEAWLRLDGQWWLTTD